MNRRRFLRKTGAGLAAALAPPRLISAHAADGRAPAAPTGVALGKPIDFAALREDFPPLKTWTYLDAAFIGLLPRQVKAAHERHLEERFRFDSFPNSSSILGVWMERAERVRRKLASFIGAGPDEIAFTLCTGCGSNIALHGIDWRQGDNAVIDDLEYPTDFHILNAIRRKGVEVRIVRNRNGLVTPDQFAAVADKRTRAFVVTHVSNINGFRHDLKKLAEIVHSFKGYLVVDAAQSIGGVKVNVKDEDVDFMSGIPYKWLNGPNGVGFLYVRRELIPAIEPDRLGWSSTNDFKSTDTMESNPLPETARRFEYGTLGYESIDGLDAALDYANAVGIDEIERRALGLTSLLRQTLQKRKIRFLTPDNTASPILSFLATDARALNMRLRDQRVYVSAKVAALQYIRVSPHYYNTEEDIERCVQAISKLI